MPAWLMAALGMLAGIPLGVAAFLGGLWVVAGLVAGSIEEDEAHHAMRQTRYTTENDER